MSCGAKDNGLAHSWQAVTPTTVQPLSAVCYLAVRDTIATSLAQFGCKDVTLTGHSLGAALATLAAYDLGATYTIQDVYNFGSPRVGNPAFASAYNAKFSNHWRVTHYKDPVPHGPTLSMGFYHIANEAYYKNTTEDGYKICTTAEDKSCADQFGGNLFSDLALAACCADDHLEYMQDAVSVATDGDSCTHIAVDTAMQHAYLTTAAYCEPEDLHRWDCGAPCNNVKGGVQGVQTFDVPFESSSTGYKKVQGIVRGYVGHVQTEVGERCVLSLRDLFSGEVGLAVIKAATAEDLETIPQPEGKAQQLLCKNASCKVNRILLDAWSELEGPLNSARSKAGCTKDAAETSNRRLLIVGHGLGSSLAALVAYQLKNGTGYREQTFGIEAGFQFGQTRVGNQAFSNAYRDLLGGEIFRVTHHKDPMVKYPKHENGYRHLTQEVFFDGPAAWDTASWTSYKRCPDSGEDPSCSQKYHQEKDGPLTDHIQYMQPLVEVDMSASACKQTVVV
jgi:hypothetical protein